MWANGWARATWWGFEVLPAVVNQALAVEQVDAFHRVGYAVGGQGHRGGALNVVIEAEAFFAVPLQDPGGVLLGEVLPLQQHVGEPFEQRLDELVDEVVIPVAG